MEAPDKKAGRSCARNGDSPACMESGVANDRPARLSCSGRGPVSSSGAGRCVPVWRGSTELDAGSSTQCFWRFVGFAAPAAHPIKCTAGEAGGGWIYLSAQSSPGSFPVPWAPLPGKQDLLHAASHLSTLGYLAVRGGEATKVMSSAQFWPWPAGFRPTVYCLGSLGVGCAVLGRFSEAGRPARTGKDGLPAGRDEGRVPP